MSSIVKIYTDGAAKGNPGRGGYGVVMKFGAKTLELSEGFWKP
jgi:ribonuclease HI